MHASELIAIVQTWARKRKDLRGLALVGSHATGSAKAESDVDFVLLVDEPTEYTDDHRWVSELGRASSTCVERWGMVTSVRVFLEDGPEVEFGFTTAHWCAVPVEPGTRQVISAGCRILLDPSGCFAAVVHACALPR